MFVAWCRRYILFHGKRHPRELALPDIGRFLQHVVTTENDPLPALQSARAALEFLYTAVLHIRVGELPWPRPPRLLDQVRQVLRVRHYALSTEECYVQWITRFILHHGKRHPRDLGAAEVEEFLTHLAVQGRVSASTQNQALCAPVFLYAEVLDLELKGIDAVRARRPKRLPVVMSPEEVAAVSRTSTARRVCIASWPSCCTELVCACWNAAVCASRISTWHAANSSFARAKATRIAS